MMPSSTAARVRKRRAALREAGLRPVQIWVPDTRRPGFAEECRRQARLAAASDLGDPDLAAFLEAAPATSKAGPGHDMRRGDFVTVSVQGDFGKPRPALIIQADAFADHATVTVLLVSSALIDAPLLRLTVQPDEANGLRKPSQIMIDKTMTIMRTRIGEAFGRLDGDAMVEVERRLAVFLGIAK